MNEQNEISEAVNAANDALYHLSRADELLASAKNWGIADILGGKLFVTAMKHGKMQDADQEIRLAKTAMSRLTKELRDVTGGLTLNSDYGGFITTADYLFDGFITDIIAQNRIKETKQKVEDAISEIEGILDALDEISRERGYI